MPAALQIAGQGPSRSTRRGAPSGPGIHTPLMLGRLASRAPRRRRQRHAMLGLLLRRGPGFTQTPRSRSKSSHLARKRLSPAGAGKEQQPDDVGGLLIGIGGEHHGQPLDLGGGQVAVRFTSWLRSTPLQGLSARHRHRVLARRTFSRAARGRGLLGRACRRA